MREASPRSHSPQAMQRLLRTAVWDADAVRDDVRGFVAAQFGDAAGVLIPDETGLLKKGTGSVGVQLFKDLAQSNISRLGFFKGYTYFMSVLGATCLLASCAYFLRRNRGAQAEVPVAVQ